MGLLGRRGKRKETRREALYEEHWLIIEFWLQLPCPLPNQTNPQQHYASSNLPLTNTTITMHHHFQHQPFFMFLNNYRFSFLMPSMSCIICMSLDLDTNGVFNLFEFSPSIHHVFFFSFWGNSYTRNKYIIPI